MKRRIWTLLMAVCLTAVTLLGTGCTSSGGNQANKEYANRDRKITLNYYLGGYGSEYWEAVAKDFMENYDEDIYLELKSHADSSNMRSLLQADENQGDIIQLGVDMFRSTTCLEELSEVLGMTALGEEVAIKDKDAERYEYFIEDYYVDGEKKTGVFQMPGAALGIYNFAYNKTTLDEVFGEEGYTLPRTTDEFFAFGETLYDKGVYLTSATLNDSTGGGDYLKYLDQLWFAQLMGAEDYDRFYMGEVYNESTKSWKLDESADVKVISDNKEEMIDAYTLCDTLYSSENPYIHSASAELDAFANNRVFLGGGFGSNRAKTAFLYIGSWLEEEIKPMIEDGLIDEGQTLGVMRTPVASSLVKYLEYRKNGKYMTDSMLSDVIEAIDSGATSYKGVSKKDFARIEEARKMVISSMSQELVVPKIKDESKREDIYKVLRYLASDRAQQVAVEHTGGLNILPFGVASDDVEVTVSNFVKEYNEVAADAKNVTIDFSHINTLASQYLLHRWYFVPGGERVNVYIYTTESTQTPEQMYNSLYNNLKATWPNYVTNYKTALGID